jgi:TM2 domain-containing membrane protein YozV
MNFFIIFLLGQSIDFAKHLEEEEDYFRAIYEYKKVYYSCEDPALKDSVSERIAYLSLKLGDYNNALTYIKRLQNESGKERKLGFVYLLMNDFKRAEELWKDNDTLMAWLYLRKGDVEKAKMHIPKIEFKRKSPFLAGFASAVVPGAGKFYSGRAFDGMLSFLINASTMYSAYRAYRSGRDVEFYLYSGLSVIFYAGDIYGSVIASQEYNEKELERISRGFETRYNVWKFWY